MSENDRLKNDSRYTSNYHVPIQICEFLSEGGQGEVYKVKYGDSYKALKKYKPGVVTKKFVDNLKLNITSGSPHPDFLWPEDFVKGFPDKTCGYIMDLRPDGYYELSRFMCRNPMHFKSTRVIVDAALNLVDAFRILHSQGYSYQDLNDGNFFFNPETGDLKIADNDNVSTNGSNLGILGKPRYMAPEIVRGEKKPDKYTDYYSLALILFLLFTNTHPLEGKRFLVEELNDKKAYKLYGSDPIFILDPINKYNRPSKEKHKNILMIWPQLPAYIRNAFTTQFSYQVMVKDPNLRYGEYDWIKLLIQLRSSIVHCNKCGGQTFVKSINKMVCDDCRNFLNVEYYLEIEDYNSPIVVDAGNAIYQSQLEICDVRDAINKVLIVLEKNNKYFLRNVSKKQIKCKTPSGKHKIVEPHGVIPVMTGIQMNMYGKTITIKEVKTK